MDTEDSLVAPISIVFISIFWILVGALILSITSGYLSHTHHTNPFGTFLLLLGIFFIVIGWGLLTSKTWAFYIALIFSILGLLPTILSLSSMILSLFFGGWNVFDPRTLFWSMTPLLFFFMFALMVGYLIRNKTYFEKKQ
jgi:hypothetical protein